MTKRIFIVEDDASIAQSLETHLNQWGFTCQIVQDFQNVEQEMLDFEAELVLLDIYLPFFNGFYWCQTIRKSSEVPIIFLSSADENMNMVMAMNMGADDFIAKPFDFSVLIAKIQALLRRSYQFGQSNLETVGDYQLDAHENQVRSSEGTVDLTPNETKLLLLLFQGAGQIVSREALMAKLWESDEFVDSNTLSVNMTRLRKKLSAIGLDKIIQTVKGRGYLLEVTQNED